MSNLSEWISVDDSQYEADHQSRVRDVIIHHTSSPHDVPVRIRGRVDDATSVFIIEFKYLDDEPTKQVRVDPRSIATVGKRSGRVYAIEIRVKGEPSTEALLHEEAGKAVSDVATAVTSSRSKAKNYELARRVIDDNWAELFSAFSNRQTA